MKILIFGASGLVGSSLTSQLKATHDVTIAVRSSSKINDKDLQIRHIDFENFNEFSRQKYDGVYCCLGTTIKQAGSKENFKKVDLDYVKFCFEYSIEVSANFFCVISALGANKKSKIFYNQIKGEMESSLQGNQRTIIVRPSLLIGERKEVRTLEQLSGAIAKPFMKILTMTLGKHAPINASTVAKSMIELSLDGHTDIKIDYIIKRPSAASL